MTPGKPQLKSDSTAPPGRWQLYLGGRVPALVMMSWLNLGSAVQVVCYELMMASLPGQQGPDQMATAEPVATQRELEHFYQHLTDVMSNVDFFNKDNPRLLDGRLRRLFNRSGLLKTEVQLLRGFFSAIEKKMADG